MPFRVQIQTPGLSDLIRRRKKISKLPPVPEPEGGHVISAIAKAVKALMPDQYNAVYRTAKGQYEDTLRDALTEAAGPVEDQILSGIQPTALGAIRQATGHVNPGAYLYRQMDSPELGFINKLFRKGLKSEAPTSTIQPPAKITLGGRYNQPHGLVFDVKDPKNTTFASPVDMWSEPELLPFSPTTKEKTIEPQRRLFNQIYPSADQFEELANLIDRDPLEAYKLWNPKARYESEPLVDYPKIAKRWANETLDSGTLSNIPILYERMLDENFPGYTNKVRRAMNVLGRLPNTRATRRWNPSKLDPILDEELIAEQGHDNVVDMIDIAKRPLKDLWKKQRDLHVGSLYPDEPSSLIQNEIIYNLGDPKELKAVTVPWETKNPSKTKKFLDFANQHKVPIMPFTPNATPREVVEGLGEWLSGRSKFWEFQESNPFNHPYGMIVSPYDPMRP